MTLTLEICALVAAVSVVAVVIIYATGGFDA